MKKIYILISVLLILFIAYLLILFLPKNYTLNYQIQEYTITESYDTSTKMYKILVEYKNKNYPLTFVDNYIKNRKIVQKLDSYEQENESCITIYLKEKKYPVCYDNENLIDFRLLSKELIKNYSKLIVNHSDKITDTYNNIKIYNYVDKEFFIWNYKGYEYISENFKKTINILNKDNYNNSLVYKNDKYLITPNYDNEYYFKELLIIDLNKLELFSFNLDHEISYSSYYLGEIKNNIYLVDKKNKKQYKINVRKESIKTIGTENKKGLIYTDKWEKISLNKLVNKEYVFPIKETYNFKLIDGKLYQIIDDYKIQLSKNKIKDIVSIDKDEIYYIVEDYLYLYKPTLGEVKLMENNEWNFNYKNKIIINN